MGRAIIGGVLTSTLLTLLVVPVVYTYLVQLPRSLRNLGRRLLRRPTQPGLPVLLGHAPADRD